MQLKLSRYVILQQKKRFALVMNNGNVDLGDLDSANNTNDNGLRLRYCFPVTHHPET